MSTDTPTQTPRTMAEMFVAENSRSPKLFVVTASFARILERENTELRGKLERLAALADQLAQRNSPNWTVEAEARDNADDIRAILNGGSK